MVAADPVPGVACAGFADAASLAVAAGLAGAASLA